MKKLLLLAFLPFYVIAFAQTEKEKVENTVQQNTIEGHIYFLSDDLLEGRETGTQGNRIAASYIANSLRKYGVKPNPKTGTYYQPFHLIETRAPEQLNVSINGTTYPLALALELQQINLSGEAIYLDYGAESDFESQNLEGRVVIVMGGTQEATDTRSVFRNGGEKKRMALEKGAIGLIELVDIEEGSWANVKHYFDGRTEIPNKKETDAPSNFFHLWVNTRGSGVTFPEGAKMSCSIQSDGKSKQQLHTQNVVGFIEGTDPKLKDEYIIYSAHYDHVGIGTPNEEGDSIYNGARDNAIGVTAVLSMAQNLGKYPSKRSALFILFTAEEKGLLGSSYYVEHPVIPLSQMVYCFNTDGGGYNDTSVATIVGLERTSAQKNIEKGAATFGLQAIGDPVPEQNLFDRSDNVSFAKKGIPAPTYSTGFTTFNEEIFKYYHQVVDEADTLDFDYLLKFYLGYVYSGRLIANDSTTPFWNMGDKYEEAGKTLYGKK